MTLVKLTQSGNTVYVNPEHVAIVSPHASLVNITNVTLVSGINVAVEGVALEIAEKLGYKISFA
jgi:hypothetical protein